MVRFSSMNNGSNLNDLEKIALLAKIESLKKDIDLVRDECQLDMLKRDLEIQRLEKINKEHQDLNGKLQLEINRLKGEM